VSVDTEAVERPAEPAGEREATLVPKSGVEAK